MQKEENYRKPSSGCKNPTSSIGNSRYRHKRAIKGLKALTISRTTGKIIPTTTRAFECNHEQRKRQHQRYCHQDFGSSTKQKDCFFNHLLSLTRNCLRRINPETSPPKTASKPPGTNASTTLVLPLLPHDTAVGFGRGGSSGASPLRQMG